MAASVAAVSEPLCSIGGSVRAGIVDLFCRCLLATCGGRVGHGSAWAMEGRRKPSEGEEAVIIQTLPVSRGFASSFLQYYYYKRKQGRSVCPLCVAPRG